MRRIGYRGRVRRALAAQSEPSDDGAIAGVVLAHQIRKKATSLADELEQAATRVVVLREARRCSVRPLIRSVRSAIWTSGEPVSPSLVAYSVMISCFVRARAALVLRHERTTVVCLLLYYDRRMVAVAAAVAANLGRRRGQRIPRRERGSGRTSSTQERAASCRIATGERSAGRPSRANDASTSPGQSTGRPRTSAAGIDAAGGSATGIEVAAPSRGGGRDASPMTRYGRRAAAAARRGRRLDRRADVRAPDLLAVDLERRHDDHVEPSSRAHLRTASGVPARS